MSNQLTGRVFISASGNRLRSMPGATLNFGGANRTARVGDSKIEGFSESLVQPSVECTIAHGADTSLQELADMSDVPLAFETDTGRIYQLSHAWLTEPPRLVGGGDVSLTFNALTCEEM